MQVQVSVRMRVECHACNASSLLLLASFFQFELKTFTDMSAMTLHWRSSFTPATPRARAHCAYSTPTATASGHDRSGRSLRGSASNGIVDLVVLEP
jgi:hypothetical protein